MGEQLLGTASPDLAVTGETRRAFLTAEWRFLAMLNYRIDPVLLKPLLPAATELDSFRGEHYISVVGFRFLGTKVRGLGIPWHKEFEEVNLRFYVRRKSSEGWRRGVVFIRELVPRRAIAFVARVFYGEPYVALPMRHKIVATETELSVEYSWQRNQHWESIRVQASGELLDIEAGSHEEFITEHYWGYTARRRRCSEYQVKHPRWRIWPGTSSRLDADVRSLYGADFAEALSTPPISAFIADGSAVTVTGNEVL